MWSSNLHGMQAVALLEKLASLEEPESALVDTSVSAMQSGAAGQLRLQAPHCPHETRHRARAPEPTQGCWQGWAAHRSTTACWTQSQRCSLCRARPS